MRLTKHEHACFTVEDSGNRVVVDPGNFTAPLADVDRVVAVVITHEHPDHWTAEHLERILGASPEARVFGPAGVAAALAGLTINGAPLEVTTVAEGDALEVGGFRLAFYGSTHAVIHSSIPVIDNVGVLINDTVFYPGDSYTVPPVAVDVLAVPAGAPWLKIGEVMDYVAAVAPKRSFSTHEAPLSEFGLGMANGRIAAVTQAAGGEFFALTPGHSLEL